MRNAVLDMQFMMLTGRPSRVVQEAVICIKGSLGEKSGQG